MKPFVTMFVERKAANSNSVLNTIHNINILL